MRVWKVERENNCMREKERVKEDWEERVIERGKDKEEGRERVCACVFESSSREGKSFPNF